jgi:hypothetical protein
MMLLILSMTVALAAPQASATSLLDLANGDSIAALGGGVVFQDFQVKAKGGTDLSTIEAIPVLGGWTILLNGPDQAKFSLEYEAVASVPVAGASLALSGTGEAKVKSEIKALDAKGKKKNVAKLGVAPGGSEAGSFDPVALLYVKTKVDVTKPPVGELTAGFVLNGVGGTAALVPEPGSALLLLAAAGCLAALRRERR